MVTIHDLSWEHHAEDFSPSRRTSFALQARWSARHAKVVVTVSDFIRRSILETYGLAPDKVVVAPNGVDPIFSSATAGQARPMLEALGVKRRYVVAVGGARRRGLPVAVEAWRRASQRMPGERFDLVVVGSEAPARREGVVHAGRVDDGTWAAILAGATAFCYPTRYEGFGMPALESAAAGVPVICAPVASLPEVLGDAAEWCASPSPADIADGLVRVLGDETRRQELSKAGRVRVAAAPTWDDAATVLADAYRRASR
jgi:alpha-1,3-rhamnosyl/mannosyltransferase